MLTSTNRLDEIADRNSRGRVMDVAFTTMIAMILVLFVLSLTAA